MMKEKKIYPHVEVDLRKMEENLAALCERCQASSVSISGVVKGFNALPEIARLYDASPVVSVDSSRLEQLRALRGTGLKKPLMLVRIPMLSELDELVKWADISLHSDLSVLRALNEAAGKQGKRHKVILMVDLGDLREGFWNWDELTAAAVEAERELPHLELYGVGTNLGCYGSIEATPEKMEQLIAAAEKVEAAIGRRLEIISGGASSSLHMVLSGTMPGRINHLRVGESLMLGGFRNCDMSGFMHTDVFTLRAEVVESRIKPSYPVGEIRVDAFGRVQTYEDRGMRARALLAVGRADYGGPCDLCPREAGIQVVGASSDHTILDIEHAARPIRVGDVLEFDLSYAAVLYLTSSRSVSIYWRNEFHF